MILLPVDIVPVKEYYKSFSNWTTLIGFWPSSELAAYYSVNAEDGSGYFTPVFLGCTEDDKVKDKYGEWTFDSEDYNNPPEDKWILYFMGCDDGSSGMRFPSREAAFRWIHQCPEVDFAQVLYGEDDKHQRKYKVEWHN